MPSSVTAFPVLDGIGPMLRSWRERRRLSQLDLASDAGVSTRHLSCVETGRSSPSRELVVHLSRHLEVPLREQNDLLLAAGYAPVHTELDLTSDAMRPVMTALDTILLGSEPNPTLVMDRHWNLVMANESAFAWTAGVPDHLLGPPLNVLRLTLHPDGLAPRIGDIDTLAAHLVDRVRRQHAITGDPLLGDLIEEATSLVPGAANRHTSPDAALPVSITVDGTTRCYLSVVSTFGTALDITSSELTIETFYEIG